jgi:NTE family protein
MSTRPSFSLVLWWWGARWYIHLGVLKYLEEHAIIPSEIVGTSIGAIIWAAWATGMPVDDIIEAFRSISRSTLFDVDFKTASIQWDQVEKLIQKTLGSQDISDLQIPFGCTATCLSDGTSKYFTSWSLIWSIRASISIPGLFSPQSIDEVKYIDGWLTANLPVLYAKYDSIIAVSAARAQDLAIERTRQFRKREIPKNPLLINREILSKSYNLLLNTQENQALALCTKDVTLIRPHNSLRLLDMDKIDEGIQMGYDEAERVLWS